MQREGNFFLRMALAITDIVQDPTCFVITRPKNKPEFNKDELCSIALRGIMLCCCDSRMYCVVSFFVWILQGRHCNAGFGLDFLLSKATQETEE